MYLFYFVVLKFYKLHVYIYVNFNKQFLRIIVYVLIMSLKIFVFFCVCFYIVLDQIFSVFHEQLLKLTKYLTFMVEFNVHNSLPKVCLKLCSNIMYNNFILYFICVMLLNTFNSVLQCDIFL